jgi:tripeptide aminopeptidase
MIECGAGADASAFNAQGVRCVNLANGMQNIHTEDEEISIADLEKMVDVTVAIVNAALVSDSSRI